MPINNDRRADRQPSNFQRTIVGFDLRRPDTLGNIFLTSYDESVRYENFMEENMDHLSPMNIFPCDPATISSIIIPQDAKIIAFDLPLEYAANLAKGNVSAPILTNIDDIGKNWQFLGFDVVDPITQLSGLSETGLTSDLLEKARTQELTTLNKNGLIDEQALALKFATTLDSHIPEHRPFVPCGVWLKIDQTTN